MCYVPLSISPHSPDYMYPDLKSMILWGGQIIQRLGGDLEVLQSQVGVETSKILKTEGIMLPVGGTGVVRDFW